MSFNPFGLFLLISRNLLRNSLWLICMCLFVSHQSVTPLSLNYNFLNVSSILCPRIHFDCPPLWDGNFPSAEAERGFAEAALELRFS